MRLSGSGCVLENSKMWQTISMGAEVGGGFGQAAGGIGQSILLGNGRDDELESDDLGVRFMIRAGYDPNEMIKVMQVLKAAGGPNRQPEFSSTHPDPRQSHRKDQRIYPKVWISRVSFTFHVLSF